MKKDGEILGVNADTIQPAHIFSDDERKILIELICEKQTQKIIKDPMCYTLRVSIAVIALFVIICVLVVAYVCLCLMTSSKDADEVERRLFNEKFNKDKGDKE